MEVRRDFEQFEALESNASTLKAGPQVLKGHGNHRIRVLGPFTRSMQQLDSGGSQAERQQGIIGVVRPCKLNGIDVVRY
jgi:hypothetical protein